MPSPEPSPGRPDALKRAWDRLPLFELAALVLAALFALAYHLRLPSLRPSDDDYRQAASTVASEAAAGDAVLLHPWWTERARLFFPETVPVIGYLDDEGDALEEHPRIWALAQPGLPQSRNGAFSQRFAPHRTLVAPTRRFGTLELSLYRNGLSRPVLFSAVNNAASALVYVDSGGGQRADCPWDGHGFRCPVGRDLRVAAEWHELLYKPVRCLWMHPPGGSARLVAEFSNVPAGRLRLESGIAWEHAWMHDPSLTPIITTVEDAQSGQSLLKLELPPGREGFQTGDLLLSQPTSVRVSTQSNNESLRDACVRLRVLGPSEAEGP